MGVLDMIPGTDKTKELCIVSRLNIVTAVVMIISSKKVQRYQLSKIKFITIHH